MDIKVAIKKPWVKYSLVAIAALGLIYIIYNYAAGSTTVVNQSGGNAADAQAAAQQNAINAQLQGQAQNIQGQINLAQISADSQTTQQNSALATQLAIAHLTTDAQMHQNDTNVAGQLQLAQIGAHNSELQITAGRDISLAQTHAAITNAMIGAQTTLGIATLNAQTQQILSSNALEGQKSNNETAVRISSGNNAAAQNASDDSMWGSIAGAAIMAFL